MALCEFWPFKTVSKISRKLFKLEACNFVSRYRGWCVDYLTKSNFFLWNYGTLQILPSLGPSKRWGQCYTNTGSSELYRPSFASNWHPDKPKYIGVTAFYRFFGSISSHASSIIALHKALQTDFLGGAPENYHNHQLVHFLQCKTLEQ